MSLCWLGRFSEGLSLIEDGLRIYSNLGHRSGLAQADSSLSEATLHLGYYKQAYDYTQLALTLSRDTGDHQRFGFSLLIQGALALIEEAYIEAQQLLQESVIVMSKMRGQVPLGFALAALGYIASKTNNFQQAQQYLLEPLQIAIETKAFFLLHVALAFVALFLANQGQHERAVEIYSLASRFPYISNSRWFEDIAGRYIAAVAAPLPPEVVTAAQERGQARDAWATAEELLETLKG
jgi:tetratricopeptide (TPR) repeat protein